MHLKKRNEKLPTKCILFPITIVGEDNGIKCVIAYVVTFMTPSLLM